MNDVIELKAARKRPKKGAFEMARDAVIVRIGSDNNLRPADKIVGLMLASLHFNRRYFTTTGVLMAWPSMQKLAQESGVSDIRRSLRRLEKFGHLETIFFGSNYAKRTSHYRAATPRTDAPLHYERNNVLPFIPEQASSPSMASNQEQASRKKVAKGE